MKTGVNMFINKYPYTDMHELNLDWCLARLREFQNDLVKMNEFLDSLKYKLDLVEEFYNAVLTGDFPDPVKEAFSEWMKKNALDLIGDLVKMVFFGLTDDGYFVSYIPDSWDDIQFGTTGLDDFPDGIDYGHLTLSY